jgi:hypothetical protein
MFPASASRNWTVARVRGLWGLPVPCSWHVLRSQAYPAEVLIRIRGNPTFGNLVSGRAPTSRDGSMLNCRRTQPLHNASADQLASQRVHKRHVTTFSHQVALLIPSWCQWPSGRIRNVGRHLGVCPRRQHPRYGSPTECSSKRFDVIAFPVCAPLVPTPDAYISMPVLLSTVGELARDA